MTKTLLLTSSAKAHGAKANKITIKGKAKATSPVIAAELAAIETPAALDILALASADADLSPTGSPSGDDLGSADNGDVMVTPVTEPVDGPMTVAAIDAGMSAAETVAAFAPAPAGTVIIDGTAAPVVDAKAALMAWLAPDNLVTIALPANTREDGRWLVAPLWKGHERWFDKTKIHGFTPLTETTLDDGRHVWGKGATVTVRRAELAYRKMSHLIPNLPPQGGVVVAVADAGAGPATMKEGATA